MKRYDSAKEVKEEIENTILATDYEIRDHDRERKQVEVDGSNRPAGVCLGGSLTRLLSKGIVVSVVDSDHDKIYLRPFETKEEVVEKTVETYSFQGE